MRDELIKKLEKITMEEKIILSGKRKIIKELYTTQKNFIIEGKKLIKRNRQINMRPHTRFTYFPEHSHDYIEMIYMYKGSTRHIINKKAILLEEGEILLLNQNAIQEILPAKKDDIAINFFILPEFFDEIFSVINSENIFYDFLADSLSGNLAGSSYLYFQIKDFLEIKDIIQNIIENIIYTISDNKSSNDKINKKYMEILILTLSEQKLRIKYDASISKQNISNLLISVLEYIDINYKNATLSEFSSIKKENPCFISKLLKKYTNYNFKELLQQKKLEKAAYMLSKTDLPVEAILAAVGYSNSSFFYKKFKEKYGLSPKNYRKQNK